MNCAVVDNNTMIVINVIVADPAIDPPPDGCILVGLIEGEFCDIGWVYDPSTNTFSNPNPPPLEEAVQLPVEEVVV